MQTHAKSHFYRFCSLCWSTPRFYPFSALFPHRGLTDVESFSTATLTYVRAPLKDMSNPLAYSAPIAPQTQSSNYPTVHNISFRPSPLSQASTRRNTKLKCPSCGVWGEKSTVCKVCRSAIPGPHRIRAPLSSETTKLQPNGSVQCFTVLQRATQASVAASGSTASKKGKSLKHNTPQTTATVLNQRAPRSLTPSPFCTATADARDHVIGGSARAAT